MIGKKIADGAYSTFLQRITGDNNPDFFVLRYSAADLCVEDLFVIPKHFFTPEMVEKRKPLAANARRAGWVGCNILIEKIPDQGKIPIVKDHVPVEKDIVIKNVQKSTLLHTTNIESRGWLMDILNCINQMEGDTFTLAEVYEKEQIFHLKYPQNHNIRPKIRQQLQILRDKNFIEFLGQGVYRKLE